MRTDGRQHNVEALGFKALRKVLQEACRHGLGVCRPRVRGAGIQRVQQLQSAPLHGLPRLQTAGRSPQQRFSGATACCLLAAGVESACAC